VKAMACGKKTPQDRVNEKINKEIKKAQVKTTVRLLLLATGDSGKSTFIKQLRLLFTEGFTDSDRVQFTTVLRDNALKSMKLLLEACEQWKIKFPKSDDMADDRSAVTDADTLDSEAAKAIAKLWKSKPIQSAWERENEISSLPGGVGAAYFFENVRRFAADDFVPSDEDICRAKMKTTGIAETTFEINEVEFVLIDVGGQRGERRKWVGCFEGVTAVIYLSAINEYDMFLEEEPDVNRLEESLRLWTTVSGAKWFNESTNPTLFMLFMNKSDLFDEKIKKKPLVEAFGDAYSTFVKGKKRSSVSKSDMDVDSEFIKKMFEANYQGVTPLRTFRTCAIDRDNCEKIFKAVQDEALQKAFNAHDM